MHHGTSPQTSTQPSVRTNFCQLRFAFGRRHSNSPHQNHPSVPHSMMLAVAPLPTLPLGRRLLRRAVAVTASAKLPNRRNSEPATGEEAATVAALAAIKSGPPHDRRARGPNPRTGGASEEEGGSRGASSLRGSDVLQALQRAVAAKEARKGRKRQPTRRSEGGGGGEGDLSGVYDYGEARPIEVRADWGPRIEELERRIQELQEQHH